MHDLELLLPELLMNTPDLSMDRIRLQGTLQQRLPSIPGAGVEAFFMGDRAAEAEAMAIAIGIAFEISRRQKMVMAARAREEDRILQALAQRRRAWWR